MRSDLELQWGIVIFTLGVHFLIKLGKSRSMNAMGGTSRLREGVDRDLPYFRERVLKDKGFSVHSSIIIECRCSHFYNFIK